MVDNIHDRVVTSNSPSKSRGGGARATGVLKIIPLEDASVSVSASRTIDAPALTGTPSYPRGGVSRGISLAEYPGIGACDNWF